MRRPSDSERKRGGDEIAKRARFDSDVSDDLPANLPEKRWARPDSNRRPPPCKGDVIPLDHEPDNLLMSDWNVLKLSPKSANKSVVNLSSLELTFARTELESCTTARTQNIALKSVYWIEKSSEILWENTHSY